MTRNTCWLVLFTVFSFNLPPIHAAEFGARFPLTGKHEYRNARGMITFSESVGSTKRDDGSTLTIEVSNVPLPPGTELYVYVHEIQVGKLKLDKKRAGRFEMTAKAPGSTPRIKTGSFVTLQLDDGTVVIW